MTSRFKNLVKNVRSSAPRAVGFLLVLFILYGTTAQAAHKHGRTSVRKTDTTVSVADAGFGSSLASTNVGCNDCLICQLHQSFSTTLLSTTSDVRPSSIRSKLRAPTIELFKSETTAAETGRAPPKTN